MKKVISLVILSLFAMAQMSACFVAGFKTENIIVSIFFFVLGGVCCLFGAVLDFLLLIMAVDIFTNVFAVLAENMVKKQETQDEEDEEEINVEDV